MNRESDRAYAVFSRCSVLVLTSVVVATGCGAGESATESQVAAVVNKDEITVHQVQHVLERRLRTMRGQPEQAANSTLDVLVEEELAAQAARAEGLDHDPDVVQAMQLARREVLAKAYQDRLASKARPSTSDEVDSYYDNHPELFEQRRLYLLQETAVEATPEQAEELGGLVQSAVGADDLADRLRAKSFRFEVRQFVQAAESLPLGLLVPMARLSKGQSLLLRQPGRMRILTVLHVQLAPVDRRTAAAPIAAFLDTERRRRLVVEGMKELRRVAVIEYKGNFAEPSASAPGFAE